MNVNCTIDFTKEIEILEFYIKKKCVETLTNTKDKELLKQITTTRTKLRQYVLTKYKNHITIKAKQGDKMNSWYIFQKKIKTEDTSNISDQISILESKLLKLEKENQELKEMKRANNTDANLEILKFQLEFFKDEYKDLKQELRELRRVEKERIKNEEEEEELSSGSSVLDNILASAVTKAMEKKTQ